MASKESPLPSEKPPLSKELKVTPNKERKTFLMFGIFSFFYFLAMLFLYVMLAMIHEDLLEDMIRTLKKLNAQHTHKLKVAHAGYQMAGAELTKLPNYLPEPGKVYRKPKKQYKTKFTKITVRSSSSWELFEKSLYYISKGRKTWYDAKNFCLSRDSHLISIVKEDEQKFLTARINESAWIGLTDEKEEGKWEWSDGSTLTVQFWAPGNPSQIKHSEDIEKDCTFINSSSEEFSWNDDNCYVLKKWICKENLYLQSINT